MRVSSVAKWKSDNHSLVLRTDVLLLSLLGASDGAGHSDSVRRAHERCAFRDDHQQVRLPLVYVRCCTTRKMRCVMCDVWCLMFDVLGVYDVMCDVWCLMFDAMCVMMWCVMCDVWCGVMFDVVVCDVGTVLCAVVWWCAIVGDMGCDLMWCVVVWCCLMCRDGVWCYLLLCCLFRDEMCCVMLCHVMWCCTIWCDVMWCGVMWCDVICCAVLSEGSRRIPFNSYQVRIQVYVVERLHSWRELIILPTRKVTFVTWTNYPSNSNPASTMM